MANENTDSNFKDLRDKIYDVLPSMDSLAGVTEGINTTHPLHGSSTENNFKVDGNRWHCFRHDSGGSKFEWIAVKNGIIDCDEAQKGCLQGSDFIDVLEIAGDMVDIGLDINPEDRKEYREKARKLKELYELNEFVTDYFHEKLMSNEEMKQWVKDKYGFDDEVLRDFRIGYAPNDKDLLKRLSNKYGKGKALKSGLFIKTSNGLIPHFQGRIIFPYFQRDKPKYFIGRKTPNTPDNKYEKSKYKKLLTHSDRHDYVSEFVKEPKYGEDSVAGADEVVITEGITDAISSLSNGFSTISPVTTHFKEEHGQELNNQLRDKTVYIAMDNEDNEAGLDGALDVIRELHESSFLIELPRPEDKDKVDLNDYFMNYDKEDFEDLKDKAIQRDLAIAKYGGSIEDYFRYAIEREGQNSERLNGDYEQDEGGYTEYYGINGVLDDPDDMEQAIRYFKSRVKDRFLDKNTRKKVLSTVVKQDIKTRGKFLKDEDEMIYYYDNKDKKVYPLDTKNDLDKEKFESYLNDVYGLNMSDSTDKFIKKELVHHSRNIAEEIKIYNQFYYDRDNHTLYIYNRGKQYFEISSDGIKSHYNGENGIYFKCDYLDGEIGYIPEDERKDLDISGVIDYTDSLPEYYNEAQLGEIDHFRRALTMRSNFEGKTALDPFEQELQLLLHLYMIPFRSVLSNRPIMAFIGEKGSGKSMTLEFINKFFSEPDFKVSTIPDEDDLKVAVSNRPIFMIDNVDSPKEWLNDILATVGTQSMDVRRQYYTTRNLDSATLDSFLGITSRSPHFKRDDVADRLLLFHVKRFDEDNGENGFIPDPELYRPLKEPEYYNQIWSEYMDNLVDIIDVFEDEMDEVLKKRTSHRISDWASLTKPISKALGIDDEVIEELLTHMNNERAMFSLEGDPLRDAIREWERKDFGAVEVKNEDSLDRVRKGEEWLSASGLSKIFNELSDSFGEDGNYERVTSLGKRLSNVYRELKRLYGVERQYNKSKEHWEYKFKTEDEDLSQKERLNQLTELIDDGIEYEDLLERVKEKELYGNNPEDSLNTDLQILKDNGDIIEQKNDYYRVV